MDNRKIDIINIAKEILSEEDFSKITIRRLAKETNVSIGTIYNIVGSKDEIFYLLIEDYWENAIREVLADTYYNSDDFLHNLEILYTNFKNESDNFHKDWIKGLVGINMHNSDIQQMTVSYKNKIREKIENLVSRDKSIKEIFKGEKLSDLSNFIFENILLLLKEKSSNLNFLKFILKELLY